MKRMHQYMLQGIFLVQNMCMLAGLSSDYGKTHFVIGVSEKELRKGLEPIKASANSSALQPGGVAHVYFSPDDDIRALLLDLITRESQHILMAAFMITDRTIAQALVDAHKRGVRVELVTDSSCVKSEAGKIAMLQQAGIPIHVYTGVAHKPATSNLMHNKFIIFGKNLGDKELVWTGSFNFTHSAQMYNQENVVLLADSLIAEKFNQRFKLLKKRCGKACVTAQATQSKK